MRPVLFAPHNDDETLFASFLIQRHDPLVVVVFKSVVQQERLGISAAEREAETQRALEILQPGGEFVEDGRQFVQWPFPDDGSVHAAEIGDAMQDLFDDEYGGEQPPIYAPARIWSGHRDHNVVAAAAQAVGHVVTEYLTYEFAGPKQTSGVEVEPTREMILRKLLALACYESQILKGPFRFWMHDLREYTRQEGETR